MTRLLVATTNPGKFAEVEAYLGGLALEIVSLQSLESYPEVVEDGATFEENALKKARIMAEATGHVTLADDSGLEVDALDGAPGIYSARYAGPECNDQKNNEKLLHELRHVPEARRTGRFVCALALCDPGGGELKSWTARGSCEGRIVFAPKGRKWIWLRSVVFLSALGPDFR
jgi:XTP/dITP diphosphohydrolase